jgi:tRNA(adenine34) deaminase
MDDQTAMQLALEQARLASAAGEVPVGALVLCHGELIATGRNAPVGTHDPSAHAEIVALRAAAQALGNYRLADCELFVTLEPCAMCSGAMLNARLKRVVYGAAEPKTGAAGSVLNLFAIAALNHQTAVQGGVLADECTAVLRRFFSTRRQLQKSQAQQNHPLRDDALRTPEARFADLPDYPWQPHYVSDLPALMGLRLHYLDESPSCEAPPAASYLCLHGSAAWSYQYRSLIAELLACGSRVVAPDLIGFGKSDKPKKAHQLTTALHQQVLLALIERLDLHQVVLITQAPPDWTARLGQRLQQAAPHRLIALRQINTPWAGQGAAANAPFPDAGHRAALRVDNSGHYD